eukprot:gene16303-biopygen17246
MPAPCPRPRQCPVTRGAWQGRAPALATSSFSQHPHLPGLCQARLLLCAPPIGNTHR